MESDYRTKTLKGFRWSFINSIGTFVISFVGSLIIARIVGPSAYGLIAYVTIFTSAFQTLTDSGFSSSLIRKNKISNQDFSTAFIFNLLVSIILYLLLYISAPHISDFFNENLLTLLLRFMGLVVIIDAISITQYTRLKKQLNFKIQAKASIYSSTLSTIIGVLMAYMDYGVWSLAWMYFIKSAINTYLLCNYSKWIPSFSFSKKSFIYMLDFGWKVLVSNIISSFWAQVYKVIIGKNYDNKILGFYTQAYNIINAFSINFTYAIKNVSYPSLSELQDNKQSFMQGYIKIYKLTAYISTICLLGLAATADSLVFVILGAEWVECSSYIRIICFGAVFYPLINLNLNVLQIYKRTDLFLYLEIIAKLIGILPLVIGAILGIKWLLWVSVIQNLIQFLLDGYYSGRIMGYKIVNQIKDLLPLMLIALSMFLVIYTLSFMSLSPYFLLPFLIIIGVTIVIFLSYIFKINEFFELKKILKGFIIK